jgi:hypothetical protein
MGTDNPCGLIPTKGRIPKLVLTGGLLRLQLQLHMLLHMSSVQSPFVTDYIIGSINQANRDLEI